MKASFTTHEVQFLMIAMIHAKTEKDSIVGNEENRAACDHIMDVLRDMNSLCNVDNDYTVKITATV